MIYTIYTYHTTWHLISTFSRYSAQTSKKFKKKHNNNKKKLTNTGGKGSRQQKNATKESQGRLASKRSFASSKMIIIETGQKDEFINRQFLEGCGPYLLGYL